jgi:hypothetical protein
VQGGVFCVATSRGQQYIYGKNGVTIDKVQMLANGNLQFTSATGSLAYQVITNVPGALMMLYILRDFTKKKKCYKFLNYFLTIKT